MALEQPGGAVDKPFQVVVGDAVTGQTLATFAPPKNTAFRSVTAAADDETFVVSAVTSSNASFLPTTKGSVTASWYEVRLAPGTEYPVSMTVLPVKPEPAGPRPLPGTFTAALSGSGQQLAVAEYTAWNGMAVKVFSVATGQLLHEWTFTDPALSPAKLRSPNGVAAAFSLPAMTWIDGDRTLALAVTDLTELGQKGQHAQSLRELDVAEPGTGHLLTDSYMVWVAPIVPYPADLKQPPAEILSECAQSPGSDLVVAADGRTFSCTAQLPSDGFTQTFRTYPVTRNTAAAEQGTNDYQVIHAEALGLDTPMVMWSSPSGAAIIVGWNSYAKGTLTDAVGGLHIGVISHGKFTPLRFPRGFTLSGDSAEIAW